MQAAFNDAERPPQTPIPAFNAGECQSRIDALQALFQTELAELRGGLLLIERRISQIDLKGINPRPQGHVPDSARRIVIFRAYMQADHDAHTARAAGRHQMADHLTQEAQRLLTASRS